MKRIRFLLISCLILLSVLLLLTACGGGKEETTAAPATTEAPATTNAPATTAVSTEAPATTNAPATTETPATTEAPQTTAAPATTAAPQTTEAPATTDAPATTAAPQTTEAPTTTAAPETTAAPQTTEAPTTTEGTLYTVTFSVEGRETSVSVPEGETPVCPTDFSEWETAENFCKVIEWDKEIVPATADAIYTATSIGRYGLKTYEIRFNMPNGIIKAMVHEGEMPTPPTNYDAKVYTVEKVGTFTGWDKEIVAPTAENMAGVKRVVYTAQYTYETRYYSIKFKIGEDEYPLTVAAKTMPECPVVPEAEGMFFTRWSQEVVPAVADVEYTAVFMVDNTPTTFTVATWNIGHFANGNARDTKITDAEYEAKSAEYRAYIDSLGADVLCLNEYSRQFTPKNSADTALFEELPPIYFAGEQRHFSCNAVFSNLSLRNIQVHDYECNKDVELLYSNTNKAYYYYYITAEMIVGDKTVHFVFTHLAFDEERDPDTVCRAQIDELIELYKDEEYVVMMGDWNAYDKDDYDAFPAAGYTLGNYGEILTCNGSRTGGLEWAVDDIIVKGLVMTDFHAVQTDLSDHIAVVATLSFPEE